MQREQALIKILIYLALSFVVLTSPANVNYFLLLFKSDYNPKTNNYFLVANFSYFIYLAKLYRTYFAFTLDIRVINDANSYLESKKLKGKIVALFGVLGREA